MSNTMNYIAIFHIKCFEKAVLQNCYAFFPCNVFNIIIYHFYNGDKLHWKYTHADAHTNARAHTHARTRTPCGFNQTWNNVGFCPVLVYVHKLAHNRSRRWRMIGVLAKQYIILLHYYSCNVTYDFPFLCLKSTKILKIIFQNLRCFIT